MKHKRPNPYQYLLIIYLRGEPLPQNTIQKLAIPPVKCYHALYQPQRPVTVPLSQLHPKPILHHSCTTRQPHVTKKKPKQNKQKNQISSEGYCSTRSIARDIISSTPGLTPYLHSRARVSSLWTAGQEEWCCRSHGARCTLSHSRCFSSGVHMPEQIIQHGLLAQSHRRSLTKAEHAWAGPLSTTFTPQTHCTLLTFHCF